MIHNKIKVNSGKYRLQKMTKAQVRAAIQGNGEFRGFLCGNRVSPAHIADGWHLGMRIDVNDIEEFETVSANFKTSLAIHTPDLGQYPHFYRIIG